MKTKRKCTTSERAIKEMEGFSQVFTVMRQEYGTSRATGPPFGGRTDSTFYNYIHRIALACLQL